MGYVYPLGYAEVPQGGTWENNMEYGNILLLLNVKTLTNVCEHAAL